MDVTYDYPSFGTVSDNYGIFTITGSEDLVNTFDDEALTFSNNQITLTNLSPGAFNANPFDGYNIQLISGPAFTNVTEDPASANDFASGSVLSFNSNDININVEDTCGACVGGEQIILDVTSATPTPEPASLALLGAGLAGIGAIRRRRRG